MIDPHAPPATTSAAAAAKTRKQRMGRDIAVAARLDASAIAAAVAPDLRYTFAP
jgi:hypothetical protein